MALPLGTAINPDLIGFLERGLVDQAAATFARNPVAARATLGQALVALFEPPVGTLIVAACLAAAAAYLLAHYGEDSPKPQQDPSRSRTWKAPAGSRLAVYATSPSTGNITLYPCPSQVIEASDLQDNPDFPGMPIFVKFTFASGSVGYTSSGDAQPLRITHCDVCPGTSNPPGVIDPVRPDYPPLTPDDVPLLQGLVTGLIPGNKKASPPDLQPQLQPILDGLDTLKKAVEDCCKADKESLDKLLAEVDKILKRVKKVSVNIGLPDLDGNNAGLPSLWDATDASDMVTCFRLIDKSLGGWTASEQIEVASVPKDFNSVKDGIITLADRIGFKVAEPTPTATDPNLVASNLQIQIRRKEVEGADPSFHLGYPDTGDKHSVIKVIYTDKSKYKRRQNASFTIPNPAPTVTEDQIKNILGSRVLGPFWCAFACKDGTKLVGWFATSAAGLSFLTAASLLNESGPANPVRFTATEKTNGVPAIAGTALTASSYLWNRLMPDATYILNKGVL